MTPKLDTDQIPDYWNVVQDPYRTDENSYVLEYYDDPDRDPISTISVEPPKSERAEYRNGQWTIEVQDRDGEGPSMNYLNPRVLVENFDELAEAYERVVELSTKFPICEREE